MKITIAILTLLLTFLANAQVRDRGPRQEKECEQKVLQTAKNEVLEVMGFADRKYERATTLSNFRGGVSSMYNTISKGYRHDVTVVFTGTTKRRSSEYTATMSVDDSCEKVEPGSYSQTPIKPIPEAETIAK